MQQLLIVQGVHLLLEQQRQQLQHRPRGQPRHPEGHHQRQKCAAPWTVRERSCRGTQAILRNAGNEQREMAAAVFMQMMCQQARGRALTGPLCILLRTGHHLSLSHALHQIPPGFAAVPH